MKERGCCWEAFDLVFLPVRVHVKDIVTCHIFLCVCGSFADGQRSAKDVTSLSLSGVLDFFKFHSINVTFFRPTSILSHFLCYHSMAAIRRRGRNVSVHTAVEKTAAS